MARTSKFLILSRLPEIYSTRRFVEEMRLAKVEGNVENPDNAYGLDGIDILIPRLGNYRYEESLTRLSQASAAFPRTRILNPPRNYHQARHKLECAKILTGLPQPVLYPRPTRFPTVVKDCLSSQGEGVFLCRNEQEFETCIKKLTNRTLLFQEFIAESSGHDVRAFIIGRKLIASMERVSADPRTEFRSNLALGGHARKVALTPAEEELCLTAVNRLGLDYAGVDFVRSNRGPLILEVNPCPGLEGIEDCTKVNIAQEIVKYAQSLLGSYSER